MQAKKAKVRDQKAKALREQRPNDTDMKISEGQAKKGAGRMPWH